jgi:hypothetical protein
MLTSACQLGFSRSIRYSLEGRQSDRSTVEAYKHVDQESEGETGADRLDRNTMEPALLARMNFVAVNDGSRHETRAYTASPGNWEGYQLRRLPPTGSQGGITPQRPTQPLSVLPAPPPAPAAHLVLPRLQFVDFVVSDEFEFILQHECGQHGYENQEQGLLLTSDISAGALYWKVPVTFFCVVRLVIWLIRGDMAEPGCAVESHAPLPTASSAPCPV